ncbi:hypothetical protein QEN19_001144 [Hanseniaspora menglaensis]
MYIKNPVLSMVFSALKLAVKKSNTDVLLSEEDEADDYLNNNLSSVLSPDYSSSNAESFIGGNIVEDSNSDSSFNGSDSTHKKGSKEKSKVFNQIFAFQLPFGGTSDSSKSSDKNNPSIFSLPTNSNSKLNLKSLVKILPKILTEDLQKTDSYNKNKLDDKEHDNKSLNKLEKCNTISSYDEYLLYRHVKGIQSDRFKAFKKLFIPNPKRLFLNGIVSSNIVSEEENYNLISEANNQNSFYDYEDLPSDFWQHDMNNNDEINVNEVFNKLSGHVIFIHGYRGSTLRLASTNERVWVPLKDTVLGHEVQSNNNLPNFLPLPNPSTRSHLIIPPSKGIFEADENIKATKILKKVGPIDIMNKLISHMRHLSEQKSDLNVWEFPYDWRLALDLTAEQLKDFIKNNIKPKEGERNDIFVVAHSMGGLITHKLMNENPLWFKGIVYVGCPSLVPNMLGPLRHGDSILKNKKILTPEVNFSFRSSFYFLPQKVKVPGVEKEETSKYGRVNGSSTYVFVNDKDFNIKYDIDYFDPDSWIKHKLSPCLDMQLREEEFKDVPFEYTPEEHYKYLKTLLPVVNNFLNSLEYDPAKRGLYPPLSVLYGNKIPTTKGCIVPSLDSVKLGDWGNFFYGKGDGVISDKWLLPQHRGFQKVGKFSSREGHVGLMTDIEGVARCFDYLLKEWELTSQH